MWNVRIIVERMIYFSFIFFITIPVGQKLGVIVHLEDPFATKLELPGWCLEMLLQYIHIIFLPHDAIYFVKCTSTSCSKAPTQHDAATPVLHSWDGILWLASLPLFPPNITMVIMAKQLYFCFIRPEDICPKSTIFVPMCSYKHLHLSHLADALIQSDLQIGKP